MALEPIGMGAVIYCIWPPGRPYDVGWCQGQPLPASHLPSCPSQWRLYTCAPSIHPGLLPWPEHSPIPPHAGRLRACARARARAKTPEPSLLDQMHICISPAADPHPVRHTQHRPCCNSAQIMTNSITNRAQHSTQPARLQQRAAATHLRSVMHLRAGTHNRPRHVRWLVVPSLLPYYVSY